MLSIHCIDSKHFVDFRTCFLKRLFFNRRTLAFGRGGGEVRAAA